MRIIDCPQGSAEWALARAGKVTASRIGDALSRARDRKSEGATRRNYKAQLVCEILTGAPQENGFTSGPMKDGIENEPLARSLYEVRNDLLVDQVGFVLHPTIERSGASPDGLVGERGMVQFKCPLAATHLSYIDEGVVPTEYQPEMLWGMECAERDWCDFVSYCPLLPPRHQLFQVRFHRDDKRIAEITAEVNVFLREVDERIERLNKRAA